MLLLVLLLCAPAWARPSVQDTFDRWLAQDRLKAAHVGFLLVRVSDGKVLASHDADRLFVPASTAKVMTARAVVAAGKLPELLTTRVWRLQVDADFWRRSQLPPPEGEGEVLFLAGGGDPELSAQGLADLAEQLRQKGVQRVSRLLVQTQQERLGRGWAWDDATDDYSAVIADLTVDRGVATIHVTPTTAGEPPVVQIPAGVELVNQLYTSTHDDWNFVRLPGLAGTVLRGEVPQGKPFALDLAVAEPERFAAHTLGRALQGRGIPVGEIVTLPTALSTSAWEPLAEHQSRPVEAILREALARSDNLAMELLIRHATGQPAPLSPPTARLVDGSGLSRYNLLSPRHLVEALQSSAKLRDLMPLAGVEGTLKNRLKGLAYRQVRAKTGTVSTVSGLAGTLFPDEPEKACVFALLTNGFTGPGRELKQAEDVLIEDLVHQLAYPYLP